MKSEKGITLISLTIYIIVLSISIGVMATISKYFVKNMKGIDERTALSEYLTFNSFFSEEINEKGLKIIESDPEGNYVVFNNGNQYYFSKANRAIYKNKFKICSGIDDCSFETFVKDETRKIRVTMKIGDQGKSVIYKMK